LLNETFTTQYRFCVTPVPTTVAEVPYVVPVAVAELMVSPPDG